MTRFYIEISGGRVGNTTYSPQRIGPLEGDLEQAREWLRDTAAQPLIQSTGRRLVLDSVAVDGEGYEGEGELVEEIFG